MLSEKQKEFIRPEDVKRLKLEHIGKTCNNKCNGTGTFLESNHWTDCECVLAFRHQIELLSANIPKKFWSFTLADLNEKFKNDNKDSLQIIYKFYELFEESLKEGVGLYLQGVSGLAKTAIASDILRYGLNHNKVGYFIHMSEIPKMLMREDIDGNKEKLKWILDDVEILVIDEVEKVYKLDNTTTSLAGTQFNEYFRKLYDSNKTIIVTSNMSKQHLKDSGAHADNILDRLNALIDVIFTGDSFRNQNNTILQLLKNKKA